MKGTVVAPEGQVMGPFSVCMGASFFGGVTVLFGYLEKITKINDYFFKIW